MRRIIFHSARPSPYPQATRRSRDLAIMSAGTCAWKYGTFSVRAVTWPAIDWDRAEEGQPSANMSRIRASAGGHSPAWWPTALAWHWWGVGV